MSNRPRPPDDATDDGLGDDKPAAIGPYRVRARLGEGGMGEVFECYDPRLMRVVAVKRVRQGKSLSAKARARFWREARALAAIDHPGVVKIFEIGETPDGALFLAMQRVPGDPLSARLHDGEAWPWEPTLTLARRLAAILEAVHAAGVVHRDLKPSNVLVPPDGLPVLVDFGIATGAEADGGPLTETGQVVGTTSYMSPEQLAGAPDIGPASDVFAWGILAYRLLSGRHPFARPTREQTAMALAAGAFPPLAPQVPSVPAAFVALIERCLARDPHARPADGAALVADVAALDGAGPAPATRAPPGTTAPKSADPTEQPAAVRPPTPALTPPSRSRRGLALGLAGLALAAGVALVVAMSGRSSDVAPDAAGPTSDAPAPAPSTALRPLPPRPTLAVLPPDGADPGWAAAFAEALRLDLDERPDDVAVLPDVALAARAEATRLAGVDVAVTGAVRDGTLTLVATDRRDGQVRWTASAPIGDDPVASARALEPGLWSMLGLDPPATTPPLRTRTSALADTLAARMAARRGDVAKVRELLATALAADPDLVPARMEELALLRTERRMDELAKAAAALLARPDLGQHDRAMASAWLALAEGDATTAVRRMYDVVAAWPYDIVAYESLLVLLFNDPTVADLEDATRVAKKALAVAPATSTIASRLVRALGFRGLGASVEPTFRELGVPYQDLLGIDAEMALYRGDYDTAIARFDAWAEAEAEHVYAVNMAIAGRILAGRCEDAAQRAMNRIQGIERRGVDVNLSWTYSLAAQALVCAERWEAVDALLDRWAASHPEDVGQVRFFRITFQLPRVDDAAFEALVVARMEEERAAGRPVDSGLCELVALVAAEPERLDRCQAEAEVQSFDLSVPTHRRTAWARLGKHIAARRLLLAGDVAGALAAFRAIVFPLADVRIEGDLGQRVYALFVLARALDRAGLRDEARATWRQVVDAGHARLYQTPLWLVAKRALAAP